MRAIVVGASGFGQIHVRELLHAGVHSLDIVGRTLESAKTTARKLSQIHRRKIRGFDRLESALESDPDIVSICTPTHFHAHYLGQLAVLGCGVLCEKPFIWSEKQTRQHLERQLIELAGLDGRLSVNYCNSFYMRHALSLMPQGEAIKKLTLRFHTNGQHRYGEIGVDLLPHAVSALQEMAEIQDISLVKIRVDRNEYQCHFFADSIECRFEFAQCPNIAKHFSIGLNDRNFIRDARVLDDVYEAGLLDQKSNERIGMVDPTRQLVTAFVEAIRAGSTPPLGFRYAAQNTRLMQRIVNHGK